MPVAYMVEDDLLEFERGNLTQAIVHSSDLFFLDASTPLYTFQQVMEVAKAILVHKQNDTYYDTNSVSNVYNISDYINKKLLQPIYKTV